MLFHREGNCGVITLQELFRVVERRALGLLIKEWGDGAGDETRTRDIFLGKEVLYQLSYTRFFSIPAGWGRPSGW